MFEGVLGIKLGYVLCGIIWSIALGFAFGNYACSLVHRLPRGRLILDKKPYCGHCGTLLQVKDLFPVVSALLLRHRCRYCNTPYPVSHTWTEILVGALFVLAFLQYNFSEQMILICAIGVFLITLAAIEANEKMIMGKVILCVLIFGLLYRTLLDHTIYDAFGGGVIALFFGAILWRKSIRMVGHIYVPPPQMQLLAVGGICVGVNGVPLLLALFSVLYGLFWLKATLQKKSVLITVPFGWALMLQLMYPKLIMGFIGI